MDVFIFFCIFQSHNEKKNLQRKTIFESQRLLWTVNGEGDKRFVLLCLYKHISSVCVFVNIKIPHVLSRTARQ